MHSTDVNGAITNKQTLRGESVCSDECCVDKEPGNCGPKVNWWKWAPPASSYCELLTCT